MSDSAQDKFIVTKEYRLFAEFCDACREYRYIGLCFGPPGVGKTWSARHYADWDRVQELQSKIWSDDFPVIPEIADCRTVFYKAPVTNTPKRIENDVIAKRIELHSVAKKTTLLLHDRVDWNEDKQTDPELIIVDEADRLKTASLEQLRDIYDETGLAVILVGMPGLEKRISRYPQLYSRVGLRHPIKALSAEEMHFILSYKWQQLGLQLDLTDFTDSESLAAVIRITGGNFRLIRRLFTEIARILKVNGLHTITKAVIDVARNNLIIGPAD